MQIINCKWEWLGKQFSFIQLSICECHRGCKSRPGSITEAERVTNWRESVLSVCRCTVKPSAQLVTGRLCLNAVECINPIQTCSARWHTSQRDMAVGTIKECSHTRHNTMSDKRQHNQERSFQLFLCTLLIMSFLCIQLILGCLDTARWHERASSSRPPKRCYDNQSQ